MFTLPRPLSRCNECPLRDRNRVWGRCDISSPLIAIVGEAPGADEDIAGEPFVGDAGREFKSAAAQSGLLWHQIYRTNVISCRPPNNDITSFDAQTAIDCCKPGYEAELAALTKRGLRIVVAAGNTAARSMGFTDSIGAARGSVRQAPNLPIPVLATYHPAYFVRRGKEPGDPTGWLKEKVSWLNDLEKSRHIALHGWNPPKELFCLRPTLGQVNTFLSRHKGKSLVSVDIEASSLDPYKAIIYMIGLGVSREEALVIPFYSQGVREYWTKDERLEVMQMLKDFFDKTEVMLQNALYDSRVLKHHGIPLKRIKHDLMLLHHSISPELPHNLGYITSIYGETPYWKDLKLEHTRAIHALSDEDYRTYNARDCVVLHQCLPKMLEHLEQNDTVSTYETEMALVKPCQLMADNGLLVDPKRLKHFQESLDEQIKKRLEEMNALTTISPHFSFTSDEHIRYLFFNMTPASYTAAKEKAKTYDNNPRLRKDTKAFAAMMETISAIEDTVPFQSSGVIVVPRLKTKNHKFSVGKEGIQSLVTSIATRIANIDKLKGRMGQSYVQQTDNLRKLLQFIEVFISAPTSYRKLSKLSSTYRSFPTAYDGRVHGSYSIHGTKTGRLSSRDPNMQNLPSAAKAVFVPKAGCSFVSADYANIELRVLAYVSDDDILIQMFNEGKDVHSENTKLLFGLDESHPLWKSARRAAKGYIFGTIYGGTVEGLHKKIAAAVPTLELTLEKFRHISTVYRAAHPKYALWYDKTIEDVERLGYVTNAFGRKRYLFGDAKGNVRKALNTPIQGTAAHVANTALIALADRLPPSSLLVSAIHDSITVECPDADVPAISALMKEVMEREYEINGHTVRFPVDLSVDKVLGESGDFSYEDDEDMENVE